MTSGWDTLRSASCRPSNLTRSRSIDPMSLASPATRRCAGSWQVSSALPQRSVPRSLRRAWRPRNNSISSWPLESTISKGFTSRVPSTRRRLPRISEAAHSGRRTPFIGAQQVIPAGTRTGASREPRRSRCARHRAPLRSLPPARSPGASPRARTLRRVLREVEGGGFPKTQPVWI